MIEKCDNYIDFLKSQYERRNRDFNFSYEYIARKLGVKSRSHMCRMFKGDRKIPPHLAIRLCKLLKISDTETDYFLTLLLLSEATTKVEREFLENKKSRLYKEITQDNYNNNHKKKLYIEV